MSDPAPYPSRTRRSTAPTLEELGPRGARRYGCLGILLPWVGVLGWGVLGPVRAPEWQSGEYRGYVGLLLQPFCTWPFWALLAFSSWAISMACSDPVHHGRKGMVRLGLIVGVLLGIQYALVLGSLLPSLFVGGTLLVGAWLAWADSHLVDEPAQVHRGGRDSDGSRLSVGCSIALLCCPLPVLALAAGGPDGSGVGLVVVFAAIGLVASWPTALMLVSALILRRVYRSTDPELRGPREPLPPVAVGCTTAGFLAASVASAASAMAHYESLPLTPPPNDCYVAGAASRGHRRWVRSEWVEPTGHGPFLVNEQLRTLKAGEIALRAVAPRLHRAVRRIYDFVGPRLAARIQSPWIADVAFAALWPLQLMTRFTLRCMGLPATTRRWRSQP